MCIASKNISALRNIDTESAVRGDGNKMKTEWVSVLSFSLLGVGALSNVYGADIYISHSADGVPTYATQALDPSYVLLFKESDREKSAARVSATPLKESADLRKRREALEPLIQSVAKRHGLEPSLVRAIAHVESRFNTHAVSPAGAAGVMQLMPGTAKRYGASSRHDAAQNIEAGARYFKDLLGQYAGNVALALAAYNSGERNVERHAKRVPPFRETMLYVPEVLTMYESYKQAERTGPEKSSP